MSILNVALLSSILAVAHKIPGPLQKYQHNVGGYLKYMEVFGKPVPISC